MPSRRICEKCAFFAPRALCDFQGAARPWHLAPRGAVAALDSVASLEVGTRKRHGPEECPLGASFFGVFDCTLLCGHARRLGAALLQRDAPSPPRGGEALKRIGPLAGPLRHSRQHRKGTTPGGLCDSSTQAQDVEAVVPNRGLSLPLAGANAQNGAGQSVCKRCVPAGWKPPVEFLGAESLWRAPRG
eukprot:CAMPEP_0184106914 /NCGR_PEP_ID=MMETSP0974-20121125/15615_1 /TAXON_ID=483370 /ORGANISM="non described non described, Strain CCMP2097" /LENGTH=187 /DNA_ID=CAMNT_0026409931 /DNA_START=45 /DNA_END=604 /DNA_ORIENTATION=-